MINPLGFPLENYDAVGRFRSEERGRAVDSAGHYLTRAGSDVEFANARDLATFLARSEETHAAFVEQLFQHLVKQPIQAYGPDELASLRKAFVDQGFKIRALMADILTETSLAPDRPSS
jgi:hypothetical protein